jgi:demethylmenaquinone methyltransferase/2-methoxy-6-polyprenyl-1,4-benzoquinol methylase
MDIFWRKKAAAMAARGGGETWLDVCSGTGDMAASLSRLAPNDARIFAADFSLPMLRQAGARADCRRVRFVLSDVKQLPFPDETFDLVTIAFATRNINVSRDKLTATLREFHRVLKPGGRFVNLETSQPPSRVLRSLFHSYVGLVVSPVGSLISGSKAGYAYLSSTIPRFYKMEELAGIMKQAGFGSVVMRRLSLGAAAVHRGVKNGVGNWS